MGSCASVHKETQESAMKLGVPFGSKNDSHVIPESPIKDTQVNVYSQVKTFADYGSKDETFFDSLPWLDSDCEDDFLSVNGEFNPSTGSTPVHHNFSVGRPPNPVSVPEPSSTGKKTLSELFRESLGGEQDAGNRNSPNMQNTEDVKTEIRQTILDVLPKSACDTPYISGADSVCGSERTANGDALIEKEKPIKSVQCCLPSLVSCRSFSDRRKKMSPARLAVNDKA